PRSERPKTLLKPKRATATSMTAKKRNDRHRQNLDDAAMALPNARPAIKLERINAAAQTEFPKLKPLSRSHNVSKMSEPIPERKRIPAKIATRTVAYKCGGRCRRPSNI